MLFTRYLDQRAGRRPSTQIGALGGFASVMCALVNNVGAMALLLMPVARLVLLVEAKRLILVVSTRFQPPTELFLSQWVPLVGPRL